MQQLEARVISVHAGSAEDLSKAERVTIELQLDGIVGDAHRSFSRTAWAGDKQAEGTVRRNERQWSAVSTEELAEISRAMDISEPLTAADVGANLCLSGVSELSRLPKGSVLKFPSGAELIVVEYNPPCLDMGENLARKYRTHSGDPLLPTTFSKAAKLTRGIVGIVDVAGVINSGDTVMIELYQTPGWLQRTPDSG